MQPRWASNAKRHLRVKLAPQRTLEKTASEALVTRWFYLWTAALLPSQFQKAIRTGPANLPMNFDATRLVGKRAILRRIGAQLMKRHRERQGQLWPEGARPAPKFGNAARGRCK